MSLRYGYLIALLFCMGMVSCGENAKTDAPAASANGLDTVPVFLLTKKKVAKKTELPAELLPYEQADLSARVQGYIREIKVDIGDRVHKGQVLAVVDAPEVNTQSSEYEASLQAAKAKYNASADHYQRLARASQAKTPGIVAPVDLERSRQQLLADSASLNAAQKLAQSYKVISGYLLLKAPFDGIVTARKADPGNLAGAGNTILTVQNNHTLRLRVAVPESFISSGAAADTVHFKTDAFPEKAFTAQLTRKSGTIDPATRTELWEYDYNNKSGELKAGTFAYVQLMMGRTGPSFVVPFTAVATTQEKRFVIRINNGKVEWIDVRKGITLDNGTEIFGNLLEGDTLVANATDERKPGSGGYWKLK